MYNWKRNKDKKPVKFIVCPFCGYNNVEERLINKYGTCLRCSKIIDKKAYLKRRLWEEKHKRKIMEGFNYYDEFKRK